MPRARPAGVSERSLDALPFFLIQQDRVFLCSSRQVTLSQSPAHPLDRRALGSFSPGGTWLAGLEPGTQTGTQALSRPVQGSALLYFPPCSLASPRTAQDRVSEPRSWKME